MEIYSTTRPLTNSDVMSIAEAVANALNEKGVELSDASISIVGNVLRQKLPVNDMDIEDEKLYDDANVIEFIEDTLKPKANFVSDPYANLHISACMTADYDGMTLSILTLDNIYPPMVAAGVRIWAKHIIRWLNAIAPLTSDPDRLFRLAETAINGGQIVEKSN